KDVLAGDAGGQGEDPFQETFFEGSPVGDGGGATRPRQDGHEGDDDDTDEGGLPVDRGAGGFEVVEVGKDLIDPDAYWFGHGGLRAVLPATSCRAWESHASAQHKATQLTRSLQSSRWPWGEDVPQAGHQAEGAGVEGLQGG